MIKAISLVIIFLLTFTFQIVGQSKYKFYNNARFGYSISYPSDLLVPQGEAENGDGQKFLSMDKSAEMLVYGRYKID